MRTKIFFLVWIVLFSALLSGCFGNDKASYLPTNAPGYVWKAEEIDMAFKVLNEEDNHETLAKYKTEEREYTIWMRFAIGRGFLVEFVDMELVKTFSENDRCILAKGNCIFRKNKLIVKLENNDTFGDVKQITFIRQDPTYGYGDSDFEETDSGAFSQEEKSNWVCDDPSMSFCVDRSRNIVFQCDIPVESKTMKTAIVFGFHSKIYFLDLSKYKAPADRFKATVIEGTYEYNGDTLIVYRESSTVLKDIPGTMTFKRTEIPEDKAEESHNEKNCLLKEEMPPDGFYGKARTAY